MPNYDIDEDAFLTQFRLQVEAAMKIVEEHGAEGENAHVALPDMFPHGLSDLTFMLFTKASRIIGYETEGKVEKIKEEIRDLINYGGFALALLYFLQHPKGQTSTAELIDRSQELIIVRGGD